MIFSPDMHALLYLGCTLPVTTCENEKNSRSCLRNSMEQERLSSLALMYTHYDIPVDLDNEL